MDMVKSNWSLNQVLTELQNGKRTTRKKKNIKKDNCTGAARTLKSSAHVPATDVQYLTHGCILRTLPLTLQKTQVK